jgi:hypothetical protein
VRPSPALEAELHEAFAEADEDARNGRLIDADEYFAHRGRRRAG